MTAYYPEIDVDREALIGTVHGLQVDLTLLAEWLAREPEPVMHQSAVIAIANARQSLEQLTPSIRR